MRDKTLVSLMSDLGKLLSDRSATPRLRALRAAHRKLREYAETHDLGEEWCDQVLLSFINLDSLSLAA